MSHLKVKWLCLTQFMHFFLFGLFVNGLIAMVLISATQGKHPIKDYWTLAARNPAMPGRKAI